MTLAFQTKEAESRRRRTGSVVWTARSTVPRCRLISCACTCRFVRLRSRSSVPAGALRTRKRRIVPARLLMDQSENSVPIVGYPRRELRGLITRVHRGRVSQPRCQTINRSSYSASFCKHMYRRDCLLAHWVWRQRVLADEIYPRRKPSQYPPGNAQTCARLVLE